MARQATRRRQGRVATTSRMTLSPASRFGGGGGAEAGRPVTRSDDRVARGPSKGAGARRAAAAGRPRLRLVPPPRADSDALPPSPRVRPARADEPAGVRLRDERSGVRVRDGAGGGGRRVAGDERRGPVARDGKRAEGRRTAKDERAGGWRGDGPYDQMADSGRPARGEIPAGHGGDSATSGRGRRPGAQPHRGALRVPGQRGESGLVGVSRSGAEVFDLTALRGAGGSRRREGGRHTPADGGLRSAVPKPPPAPPVRLTRRGRAVLVMALALLSLAGFWLGILAASHASAGPAGASPPWAEVHQGYTTSRAIP